MERESNFTTNDEPQDNGQWGTLADIEFAPDAEAGNPDNGQWGTLADVEFTPNVEASTDSPKNSTASLDFTETLDASLIEASKAPVAPEALSIENQKAILDSLPSPTSTPEGIKSATQEILKNESESRILAWVTDSNPYRLEQLSDENLASFVAKYPNPADFQTYSDSFMVMIKAYSSQDSIKKYETAMANFKNKVYGLKQVYYDQMKTLNTLLERQPISSIQEETSLNQHQIERSSEWMPGTVGVSQVSRAQVAANELSDTLHPDETCQDAYILRPDSSVFGVFDGVGGHAGGRTASHIAAETVNRACDKYNITSGSDLAHILNSASHDVEKATYGAGYTTATLAKIITREDGQKKLAYAQVGDSRLYVVHINGTAEQITKDEGEENVVYNALGRGEEYPTKQYGEISVVNGDRIVLCSDGITGDRGDDLMSPEELGRIVTNSRTPEEASANLVVSARKRDDRTAVVFGI